MSLPPDSSDGRDAAEAEALVAMERAAADWLIAHDRGFTPAQKAEFSAWLAADPRHAELYSEMEETWNHIGELAADESIPATSIPTPLPAPPARIVWFWVPLAAAAASILLVWTVWRPSSPRSLDYTEVASTPIGATRKVDLPDGSAVRLNTASAISVDLSASERRVQLLRGEAFFQVAKNAARPFIVTAGGVAVRAVGTGFDVRVRPTSVEVLVTEGKVRVSDAGRGTSLLSPSPADAEPPVLTAGQRLIVNTRSATENATVATSSVATGEIEQALAWQSGRLEFVAVPLATIADEFNRYNQHKLVITDPRLAVRRFGGTFGTGDYDAFVHVLETEFGVIAERSEAQTKLRLAP